MKKLLQKVIKYKKAYVNLIFTEPIVGIEWILFGKFKILKYTK